MSKLHDVFMKTAFLFAEKSHCVSHHVGAVIVKDGRIVTVGYNGSPPGLPNCDNIFDKDNFERKKHSPWSDDHEVHAEMNAIAFAAKTNVEIDGCDMYCTISPCNQCLKNIIMAGIKNVYYLYKYDRIKVNNALLSKVNVSEVSGASEIKKWVEFNNLLYIPKQKQDDQIWDWYLKGYNEQKNELFNINSYSNETFKGINRLLKKSYLKGANDEISLLTHQSKESVISIIRKK